MVAETKGDKLSGSSGFKDVAGWVTLLVQFNQILFGALCSFSFGNKSLM